MKKIVCDKNVFNNLRIVYCEKSVRYYNIGLCVKMTNFFIYNLEYPVPSRLSCFLLLILLLEFKN